MRLYRDEDDYWRIRQFLRETFLANGRRELSWQAYRFDYWRWHGIENMGHGRLEEDVFVWEMGDGRIVAVLNREGPGQVFLHVHPEHRAAELEEFMISVAEEHLAVSGPGDRRKINIWTDTGDRLRQDILKRRGYAIVDKPDSKEYQRRRSMSTPIVKAPLAAGYKVRALGGPDDHRLRSWLSWRTFHPDEPDDKYEGWEWYLNIQRAPLYRRDLDMVAVAPGGEFASFCTAWFDDVTRTGAFEPVGTAPEHQRHGLGKAVMTEGLRRLKGLGATLVYVGSLTPGAHALYASVGFTEYDVSEPWTKQW
jgi:mycothiol synthase